MKTLIVLLCASAVLGIKLSENDFKQIHLQKGFGYAICSGTESYYTHDPDNCRNFYGCVYDEHLDIFHLYKYECQDGLAYDIPSHSCQYEESVDRCWYTCEDNWQLFQGSCYFFTRQKKNIHDAQKFCQDSDAYVVEIESKDEDDFIIEIALENANGANDGLDYWLGAEKDQNGNWVWMSSGNPVTYSNWWTDHGRLDSNYVQLLKNGQTNPRKLDSFYWTMAANKGHNDGDNGIICEKKPNSSLENQ